MKGHRGRGIVCPEWHCETERLEARARPWSPHTSSGRCLPVSSQRGRCGSRRRGRCGRGPALLRAASRPLSTSRSTMCAFSVAARFPIARRSCAEVVDEYVAGAGRLDVGILGRTLQHEQGEDMAVGEAMRYLAELPWVRTRWHSTPNSSGLTSTRGVSRSRLTSPGRPRASRSSSTRRGTSCELRPPRARSSRARHGLRRPGR